MSDDLVIVPSAGDGYIELARTKSGRLFRKHLLNLGNLRHPTTGQTITIDDEFVTKLKKNFTDGVCDIVQVPLANHKNEHSEDPERNIGEVVDIQVQNKKVYAVIDVRDPKHADRLGKTYLGASAMMHLDYTDTRTGKKVGPTLLHSCVTNRPYVTGLENYEEIVAATSDTSKDAAVLLTEETVVVQPADVEETDMGDKPDETPVKPSLEDLLTTLKNEHNIDVSALQAKAAETERAKTAEAEQAASLSKTLLDALSKAGVVKLSNDTQIADDTVVTAVQELASNNVTLSNRVQALEKQDAEHAVDALIAEVRVLPAQRDAYVELKLTNPAMFAALVPEKPLIALSNETGKNIPAADAQERDIDVDIARLSAMANGMSAK